jgi:hypothetical protein
MASIYSVTVDYRAPGLAVGSKVMRDGKEILQVDVEHMPLPSPAPALTWRVAISVLANTPGFDRGRVSAEDDRDIRVAFAQARANYEQACARSPHEYPTPSLGPADWEALEAELRNAGAFTVE